MIHVHYNCSTKFTDRLTEHNVLNSPQGEYVCLEHVDVEELFEAAEEDNNEANSRAKAAKTDSTSSTDSMRRRRRKG